MSKKINRRGIDQFLNLPEIQLWNSTLLLTALESLLPKVLLMINYSFVSQKSIKKGENSDFIILRSMITNQNNQNNQIDILKFFYLYWPYLSRMKSEVKNLIKKSKIIDIISKNCFFLSINGFQYISEIFLPIIPLTKKSSNYLQKYFPLADVPNEIVKDFITLNIKYNEFTSSLLREKLKQNVAEHSLFLSKNFDILLSLLHYSCLDFMSYENQNFKDLGGTYVHTFICLCTLDNFFVLGKIVNHQVLFIYLFIYLFIHLFIYLFINLSIY